MHGFADAVHSWLVLHLTHDKNADIIVIIIPGIMVTNTTTLHLISSKFSST